MHCCCMQARAPGASQLGVRPPLGRPQLCCWWLPVPPPAETPDWPATLTSSSTPCRHPHSWTCSRQQQQTAAIDSPTCPTSVTQDIRCTHARNSAVWITPLKRSADGGADVARSERLRPACVFTRPLSPSHPFFSNALCFGAR